MPAPDENSYGGVGSLNPPLSKRLSCASVGSHYEYRTFLIHQSTKKLYVLNVIDIKNATLLRLLETLFEKPQVGTLYDNQSDLLISIRWTRQLRFPYTLRKQFLQRDIMAQGHAVLLVFELMEMDFNRKEQPVIRFEYHPLLLYHALDDETQFLRALTAEFTSWMSDFSDIVAAETKDGRDVYHPKQLMKQIGLPEGKTRFFDRLQRLELTWEAHPDQPATDRDIQNFHVPPLLAIEETRITEEVRAKRKAEGTYAPIDSISWR